MPKLRPVLAAAALGVFAVGCTSSSNPAVLPTLTATPSASPTSVAIPAVATALSEPGAEAFTHFFFSQMNAGFKLSQPELFTGLVTADCQTCRNYARSLASGSTTRTTLSTDTFILASVAAAPVSKGICYVVVAGHVPARDVLSSEGAVVDHLAAGGAFRFNVKLRYSRQAWLVADIARLT